MRIIARDFNQRLCVEYNGSLTMHVYRMSDEGSGVQGSALDIRTLGYASGRDVPKGAARNAARRWLREIARGA